MWFVNWTIEAEQQLFLLSKIYLEFQQAEKLLSYNPYLGQEYEISSYLKIRKFIILKNFSIIYRITDKIEVLSFWDNRQNPKKLEDFFKV